MSTPNEKKTATLRWVLDVEVYLPENEDDHLEKLAEIEHLVKRRMELLAVNTKGGSYPDVKSVTYEMDVV
jgi:hypothetical protein